MAFIPNERISRAQPIFTLFDITEEQQPKVLPTIVIKAQDKATGDTQKL